MFGIFRMPRFLRQFIRRRTKEMPEQKALKIKQSFAIAYAFVAWNLFGGLMYMFYKGRMEKMDDKDKELSQGRQFAKLLHMENVTLHQMKGFRYVEKYDLNKENLLGTHDTNEDEQILQEESELKDSE